MVSAALNRCGGHRELRRLHIGRYDGRYVISFTMTWAGRTVEHKVVKASSGDSESGEVIKKHLFALDALFSTPARQRGFPPQVTIGDPRNGDYPRRLSGPAVLPGAALG